MGVASHRCSPACSLCFSPHSTRATAAPINAGMRFYAAILALLILIFGSPALAVNIQTGVTIGVVPNAPSNFTATPTSPTQAVLSWTDNSNNTEDGFSIERKVGVGGTYAEVATTPTGVATYIDNG